MMTASNTTLAASSVSQSKPPDIMPYANVPETIILLTVTAVGCLGNATAILTIILFRKFRKSSTAFICHQCFLDCIKGLYNFLYGYNLLHQSEVPVCYAVGASYVFFVTVSAYNLLAIVVNEELEMQRPSEVRQNNYCCVIFGITLLWFMCVLIDMGVAFLPKEPEYIPGVGSCIFSYGTPSNFVLHILWIILVSMAIFWALTHFMTMCCRIRLKSKSLKWAFIHRSLLREVFSNNANNDDDMQTARDGCHSNSLYTHLYLRRITILTAMVVCYILFWYPLFILTIVDYRFKAPKMVYKILTILSWCHPATTCIFTFLILIDMAKKDGLTRRIYSNIYPMMQFYTSPADHPIICNNWDEMDHRGIQNTHYCMDETELKKEDDETDMLLRATRDHPAENHQIGNCMVQSNPVVIEQWDRSPTSPGRTRSNPQTLNTANK